MNDIRKKVTWIEKSKGFIKVFQNCSSFYIDFSGHGWFDNIKTLKFCIQ